MDIMNPSSAAHRYIVLALICTLGFGNYFCFDTPGSLESIIEDAMSVRTSSYTSLYALYSWPNVFMCFIGGLLIDRVLGIRLGAIVFLVLLTVGQSLFALGAFVDHFIVMQIGRFIYGLGGETLAVAQNTYTVSWFKGGELNTVFGLQITVSRLGSTLAFFTMLPILNAFKAAYTLRIALGYTLLIASTACVISLIASVILAAIDKRAERILQRTVPRNEGPARFQDVVSFKTEFWMLAIICVTFYVTIFPLISIGARFFQNKWSVDPVMANHADTVIYLIAAITSPFIGLLVDKVGRNLVFLLVASVIVLVGHLLMAVTFINLWVALASIGIGYSIMCSALWPLVAIAVPQEQLGTAYGVMQSVQNLGLAVAANLTGLLVDWKGYITVEMFFVLWVSVSVIFSMLLLVHDQLHGGSLNRSAAERKRIETESQ